MATINRFGLALCALFVCIGPLGSQRVARAQAPEQDIRKQLIDALIADLSSEIYDQREEATLILRHMGESAVPALEKAVEDPDEEVQYRASSVLSDLERGIDPEWPAQVVLQLRHYERLPQNERLALMTVFSAQLRGEFVPFLRYRAAHGNRQEVAHAFDSLGIILSTPAAARETLQLLAKPKTDFDLAAAALAHVQLGNPLDATLVFARAEKLEGPALEMRKALEAASKLAASVKYDEAIAKVKEARKALQTVIEQDVDLGAAGTITPAGLDNVVKDLEAKAALYPAAARRTTFSPDQIKPSVHVFVGDNPELQLYQEVQYNLFNVERSLNLDVRPHGVRMLTLHQLALRYDRRAHQLQAFYGALPLSPAVPFEFEGDEEPLVVYSDDSIYFYNVSSHTDRPSRLESYEKDFLVTFEIGEELIECRDLRFTIDGLPYERDEILRGLPFDRLPNTLTLEAIGSSGDGEIRTGTFTMELVEPPIEPMEPAPPAEEEEPDDAPPEVAL